jgi:MFS transporter, UMF1 family
LIAKDTDMDRLSGQGYAMGYLGGGILFTFNILFIQYSHIFSVQKELAVRLSLASAGIWWAFFGTVSFVMFREEKPGEQAALKFYQAGREGLKQVWKNTQEALKHRQVILFLMAFMIYNDAVQTVIRMAAIFGKEELHLPSGTLMGTLLMVQFIGIPGALCMSRIARRFGPKGTVLGALAIWIAVAVYASRISSSAEFWVLGVATGLILGGTQALSRSFYAKLIPDGRSAQFFGYYSVFSKLSAIWGPVVFAFIRQATGTSRLSVLSLSLFFLLGGGILYCVKDKQSGG